MGLNILFVQVAPTCSLWSRQAGSKWAKYKELQVSAGQEQLMPDSDRSVRMGTSAATAEDTGNAWTQSTL